MRTSLLAAVLVALAVVLAASWTQAADAPKAAAPKVPDKPKGDQTISPAGAEGTQVQFLSKLGVQTTFTIRHITHGDDLLNRAAAGCMGNTFVLSLGDGVFLGLPCDGIREAALSNGLHSVTLTSGEFVSGKLISTVTTSDNKKYDLSTATRLTLTPPIRQAIPGSSQPGGKKAAQPPIEWELRITKPSEKQYTVTNPRFVLQYYSSSGYLIGGSQHETESTSFYLKVGNEEILAELYDFAQLIMDTKLTVKTASGTGTTGDLDLKAQDDKGDHWAGQRALVADLTGGRIILVRDAGWALKKLNR